MLCASCAFSQTSIVTDKNVVVPEVPRSLSGLEAFGQTLFNAGAASVAIYPSYDPYITVGGVSKPWGFGAAILYPVSQYAFAGLRLDYLTDHFWAPSAVAGAKYTLKSWPFTPTVFTVGGIILPVAGAGDANSVAEGIAGLGVTATFYQSKDGRFSFNGFIEGEKWTNFKGVIVHPGVALAIKF